MKKRVRRAVTLLLVVVVVFTAWQVCRQSEPVYAGKELSVWLQTYAPSSPVGRGSPQWREADDAMRHIGTNSIPVLLQMLRATDGKAKAWLMVLAQKQRVVRIHFVPAAVRNIEASRAFIALGDTAKNAVPELMVVYKEENSIESQGAVLESLGWIGPAAKAAIPLLLSAATNSNTKLRASALWTLGEIHADPDLCVPILVHALGDSNEWVLVSAVHALGAFGTEAQTAAPALSELASSPIAPGKFRANWVQVRLEAKNALRKINRAVVPASNETLPEFEIPLGDPLLSPR